MARIWILEPDENLGESLSAAIREAGLMAVHFREGAQAVSTVKREPPGLIILDLAIDDGKGLELCHTIREIPGVDLVPILFIGGGEGGVKSFGDALAEGGDYFFSKPPEVSQVVSKILTYVGIDHEKSTLPTGPALVASAEAEVPSKEPPQKDEQAANLAGRVEQMLNLGTAFKDGILAPLDATADAESRLARLEQEIADEGILPEAGRATIPVPASAEKAMAAPEPATKELALESPPKVTTISSTPPEKVPGGVILQAPIGSVHETKEESAEAVFAKLAAELFEEQAKDSTRGEEAKTFILPPGVETKPPQKPLVQPAEQPIKKPKTAAKQISEAESPSRPSTSSKRVDQLGQTAAEVASGVPTPPQPEPQSKQEQSPKAPTLPPRSTTPTTIDEQPKTTSPSTRTPPLEIEDISEDDTESLPPSAPEEPLEGSEADDISMDEGTKVRPLRPTPVRRTYNQRRRIGGQAQTEQASSTLHQDPAAAKQREPESEVEPNRHIDELFTPAAPPQYKAPDPVSSELSNEAVPFLLWRLHTQKVTGKVVIRSGSDSKTLYFEDGVPAGVHSTASHERLEELLLREGLLDRAAYTEARVKDLTSARQLAAHLVERGWLRSNELFPLVRRHLEEGVVALFEWDTGSVAFENILIPDMEKVRLSRPLASLIMAGVRRKFLLERLIHELGGPASLIAPTPKEKRSDVTPDGEALGLTRQEREILHLVNGLRPIEEIIFVSGCDAVLVYRVLFAGLVTGLLTMLVKGIRPSEGESEALKRELAIGKRRIEAKLEHINRGSYFAILGVSEKASAYEIEEAYQRASREFHPIQFAHPSYQNVASQLALIRRTLDEAYEVLGDEFLRENYRRSLTSSNEQQ